MKILLNTLVSFSSLLSILVLGLFLSGHLVVVQVNQPRVVDIVDENHKVLWQMQAGVDTFYKVQFVK